MSREEYKDAIEVSVIFHEGQRMFAVPKQVEQQEPVALKPCWYESKEKTMCRKCGQVHAEAIPTAAQQPTQTDWEAVAADQAMTIALLKAELQEFANKEADAVEVALTESGWVWDGDQWQRPAQRKPLTDEEIDAIDQSMCGEREFYVAFARGIEAAHDIKEKP